MANLLTALLGKAESNWGMDEAAIQDAMSRIAFHESKSDPTAMQLLDDGSYGVGRGLYQYEIGDKGGAHTAINRLLEFNKVSGNKYDVKFAQDMLSNNLYDFSQLTPEQQNMLFLADKLGDKTANMGTYDVEGAFDKLGNPIGDNKLSDEELAGFHTDEHWAGYGGVEDFIYNLLGGQGPEQSPSSQKKITDERQSFIDKLLLDYQFYKP